MKAKAQVNGINKNGASTDHASLSVEAESPFDKKKMNGTIEMAKEDGAWKILKEKWKN